MKNFSQKKDVFNSYLVEGTRFSGYMELPSLTANLSVPESLTEFRSKY